MQARAYPRFAPDGVQPGDDELRWHYADMAALFRDLGKRPSAIVLDSSDVRADGTCAYAAVRFRDGDFFGLESFLEAQLQQMAADWNVAVAPGGTPPRTVGSVRMVRLSDFTTDKRGKF